jgi:hypothetical protein
MFSFEKHIAVFALVTIPACRPTSTSTLRSTETSPIGLAAATSLVEGENGMFSITCLGGTTESHTKDALAANKVCAKKVTTTSATAPVTSAPALNAPESANGISLFFGASSYLKAEAIDCTGGDSCIDNENACRIEVTNTPVALKVKSFSRSPRRNYDHIVAERFPSAGCKLSTVHIYFPHLVVPVQFDADTPVAAGCVLKAGTTLEGAILQDPTSPNFNFLVSKGSGCASSGATLKGMNVHSLSSPSNLLSTILGL